MRADILTQRALRLGFRQISGFSEAWGETIEQARGAGFDSIRDLWLRTGLPAKALEKLAQADAFGSLGLSRCDALWAVKLCGVRETRTTCRCLPTPPCARSSPI